MNSLGAESLSPIGDDRPRLARYKIGEFMPDLPSGDYANLVSRVSDVLDWLLNEESTVQRAVKADYRCKSFQEQRLNQLYGFDSKGNPLSEPVVLPLSETAATVRRLQSRNGEATQFDELWLKAYEQAARDGFSDIASQLRKLRKSRDGFLKAAVQAVATGKPKAFKKSFAATLDGLRLLCGSPKLPRIQTENPSDAGELKSADSTPTTARNDQVGNAQQKLTGARDSETSFARPTSPEWGPALKRIIECIDAVFEAGNADADSRASELAEAIARLEESLQDCPLLPRPDCVINEGRRELQNREAAQTIEAAREYEATCVDSANTNPEQWEQRLAATAELRAWRDSLVVTGRLAFTDVEVKDASARLTEFYKTGFISDSRLNPETAHILNRIRNCIQQVFVFIDHGPLHLGVAGPEMQIRQLLKSGVRECPETMTADFANALQSTLDELLLAAGQTETTYSNRTETIDRLLVELQRHDNALQRMLMLSKPRAETPSKQHVPPVPDNAKPEVNPPKSDQAGKRRQQRGKQSISEVDAKNRFELIERWQKAKEGGTSQKLFCQDEKVSVKTLERYLSWARMRKRRTEQKRTK